MLSIFDILTTGEIFNYLNLLSHFYFILVNYYYNDNIVTKIFYIHEKPEFAHFRPIMTNYNRYTEKWCKKYEKVPMT